MDIHNRRHIRAVAADRLEKADQLPRLTLIYGGIVALTTLVPSLINYLLGLQISKFGGLQNLGTRSLLSSFQTMLNLVIPFLTMALELGFINIMLRVSRSQFISLQTIRMGFARFWPLFKTQMLITFLCVGAVILSGHVASLVFMMTSGFQKINALMASAGDSDLMSLLENPQLVAQIAKAAMPVYILMGILILAAFLVILYHYRMVKYIIIDKPGMPAMLILRESWRMMKKNCKAMFRVDLSLWWYYLALFGTTLLLYGDMILSLFGVALPFSDTVSYFLFMILYLLATIAVICLLRPRVEVTYALAYEALRPQDPPQTEGAVLGNIFNM